MGEVTAPPSGKAERHRKGPLSLMIPHCIII